MRRLLLAAGLVFVAAAVGGCHGSAATNAAHKPASGGTPAAYPPAAYQPTPVPGVQGPLFGALGGYGCPQGRQVTFTEAGWYADGINGFIGVDQGGWDKQGCDGRFDAMPMSGNAIKPDPSNYALWTFRTAPVTAGRCSVAVYVPDDPSVLHVGGQPARYEVYDSAAGRGTPVGSFTVEEVTHRGQWVSAGSFPVTASVLTVKLLSAGQDWHGDVVTHAHLPVSQLMAFCGK